MAAGQAHKSSAAGQGENLESVYLRYGTKDFKTIAKISTAKNQGASPILHTTRDKNLATRLGSKGVVVTYKIPKTWLLEESHKPILGNIGEKELDFLFELPSEFVDKVEQLGNGVGVISTPELAPNQPDQILDIDVNDLPPTPGQGLPSF